MASTEILFNANFVKTEMMNSVSLQNIFLPTLSSVLVHRQTKGDIFNSNYLQRKRKDDELAILSNVSCRYSCLSIDYIISHKQIRYPTQPTYDFIGPEFKPQMQL